MSQETWGLKLDSELKEKIQEIIKNNFDSSKDFMEQLVSVYELNQLKQEENVLVSEVEELESLTRRINSIFINANARINTMLQDKDLFAEKQVEVKNQLIERLQNSITNLEHEKVELNNEVDDLKNINEEYKEEMQQLTESNQTLSALVTEYKEKNDTLAGLLAEYKEDREYAKKVQGENKELIEKLHKAEDVASKYVNEIDRYKAQMEDQENKHKEYIKESKLKLQEQEEEYKEYIQQIEVRYGKEVDTARREAEVEANLKILELQQEYQKKLQDLQDKHNREVEQYQGKYKELLEQLEKSKVTQKATPKTAKPKTTKKTSEPEKQ